MEFYLPEESSSSPDSEQDYVWSEDEAGCETDLANPTMIADSAWLLAGDNRPPEYYIQLAEGGLQSRYNPPPRSDWRAVVNAVMVYCKIEEGNMRGGRKRSGGRLKRAVIKESPSPEGEALKAVMLSMYINDLEVLFHVLGQ